MKFVTTLFAGALLAGGMLFGGSLTHAADDDANDRPHCCMRNSAAAAPAATSQPSTQPSGKVYVCPMHPEVTSDQPDARCPKCGMKLVEKKTKSE